MSFTFSVETSTLPSFTELIAAAQIGEPVQLAGAGFTGEPWPHGLFAKVADASTVASTIELTPELEATFTRAGLSGSFIAYVRASARGVVVSRTPAGISFVVLALASPADYALAIQLAAAAAKLAGSKVQPEHALPGPDGALWAQGAALPDEALRQFDAKFADENAKQIGTWLAEDIGEGRTYFFQGPRGFVTISPADLKDVPKDERLDRARRILLGDDAAPEVTVGDPRRDAVLLTAAMVYAAGADGKLDEEEAAQLEAHFATITELRAFKGRDLFEAVKNEVSGIEALRGLGSPALRKKAFVLAGEVIASARGGKLTGEASDPNVQAISALAAALGLDGDQTFIARVVTAVMAKYEAAQVSDEIARSFVLGMLLAAAADGHVDDREAALLSALARTVPELRSRDVPKLFEAARLRMDGGLEAALGDLERVGAYQNKCFALAAEVALVAGQGPAGTMLPTLRARIKPDAGYAECAIATFAAKYA